MLAYLPFGDYSGDGHRECEYILVDIDNIDAIIQAQEKIKEKYGITFFSTFANDYEDSYLKDIHWKALTDTNYPIERLIEKDECNDWSGCESISEVLSIDPQPSVSIEFIEDAYIWLMNDFGANIKISPYKVPVLGWNIANDLEIVGYGCFD
jgi:hypothetical protein